MQKTGFERIFLWLLFVVAAFTAQAQNKFTLNGVVRDKTSGELLIGAVIQLKEIPGIGVTTNAYGFYSITVKPGTYTVMVSYAGYATINEKINFNSNREQNFNMVPLTNTLQEVVVSSKKKNENVAKPLMGVDKLNMREVNQLPVLLGERDVLKSIQLLPGIKSAGDGNSGFFVRGGGADQNLILLDEAPVYNASHLLGFFSTFNSDAIKDVTVYKGGMPAQYGGRLSSVVDIKMKDGNDKEYHVDGGVGLIASRLTVEGPIVKNKGSFIISGRRTYADLFLKLSPDSAINTNTLYFYDLNLKANYTLNNKNHLYLSGYFGRDVLGFGETFGSDWGNATGTLRWNHIVSNKLFSNTSLIFSNYNYVIRIKSGTDQFKITSKIQDWNLKQDFDYFINNNNKIKFGGNIIHHTVSPGAITASATSNLKSATIQNRYSYESALYVSHELSFNDKLNIVYGLRLSNLSAVGPGNYYQYDSNGNTIDTLHVPKGKAVVSYWNLEPRFSASYLLNTYASLKFSYNRNVQNLHLLSNSTVGAPTDLWLPSTNNVKPEIADQVAIGYYKNSKNQVYEFSVETYYKWLQNQIDYRNGADLQANDNVESELIYGIGRAYGIEFFAKKKVGKLTGWIGYTLSRTERKFPGINNNQYFPARQDQTHAITVVGIYQVNQRWSLSANWVYNTGNAVTYPSGKYRVNDQTVFLYTERNGYRMPAYHRLDIAATVQNKHNPYRKYQSSLTFGVYNVYGRENPYFITFIDDPNNPNKTVAQQTSLFRFIPSITWNFKF
ncbi:TonB-dependent receptor [Hydrotalea sandarakina]|uniref:Outer membrane receptor for ferrienterochelin and colicin n=1 Tax=Hydrotalea sandarakina TaxID=1004304 RepID=A0A2W7T8A9_9BACT|nr:TonB-dependent receptor [Hydrotalea sandarakina]PZX59462.1 outer membrane receptor for ferrienterochelin and colicin [Hydrotalea sandarakina]